MGVHKFAIKTLKSDKKQSLFFICSIMLSVAVVFNIFNIIYNKNLMEFQKQYFDIFNIIALSIIIVTIFFIFFASSFFLLNKSKELGIAALSGLSTFNLSSILITQTLIIVAIAVALGLVVGFIISPMFLSAMFTAIGITGNLLEVSKEGMFLTIVFIIVLGMYVVLFNWGYVYRTELIDLVNAKKKVTEPDDRMVKIPKLTYLIVFLLPSIFLFIRIDEPEKAFLAFVVMLITTYGTQGTIRYLIPYKILEYKKKYFFDDKLKIISLSNLYYSLRRAIPLVVILAIGSTLSISLIGSYYDVAAVKYICVFAYVLITILISISIIYKVMIEVYNNRRNSFLQLKMIGYNKDQIINIILQEIILFNLVIIGAPLFHIIILLITYVRVNIMTLGLALMLLGIFLGCYMISGIISYLGYKKIVISYLYGGNDR